MFMDNKVICTDNAFITSISGTTSATGPGQNKWIIAVTNIKCSNNTNLSDATITNQYSPELMINGFVINRSAGVIASTLSPAVVNCADEKK